ncbi:MAG: Stk1 family PASTA domain-containing Ser/Thr kinase [Bacilli bacterium]
MIVKGQKVNSRYEIIKTIGEGGMANVYLARDIILDRNVAIKVLRGDLASDEKFVRRFQREALSASSLSHPNIVEIYDVGEDDGDYYIVMEYVEGKNLKQLLKKREKLTAAEVVDIMLQITSAMGVAHDSLIIHRDLKPQNILIKDDGEIKITDFGIAMALNATQLTQTNSAMGSVHYFPPEQANGKGSSLKSDVYSLGIMMYELLTGVLPFRGDNAVEIALKHLKEPIPLIRTELPELPQSLENIIIKATAKNPKNRYANANEMHDDLLTALNKERENEPPIVLKYDEGIEEDPVIADKDNLDDAIVSQIKDDKKPKNKKLIILGSVFGGLVILTFFALLILPMITKVPEVTIPDVSNLTVEEATKKLEKAGLEVSAKTEEEASDKIDKGKIIETNPKIGKTVKEGTEITLVVSSGITKIKIEDYTGENYIKIETQLELAGLKVSVEKQDTTSQISDDESQNIIGQSIDPGKEVDKGTEIILYIPNIKKYYPDMVGEGWTLGEARTFATENNIKLSVIYRETNSYDPGIVIKQSKTSSDELKSGDTLTVTISKEKQTSSSNTTTNNNSNNNSSSNDSNTEKEETQEKTE